MANEAAPQEEVRKNCPACKKILKRSKKYYREGDYYCNKNCWAKTKQGAADDASEAAA
jgi:hypothetical protein